MADEIVVFGPNARLMVTFDGVQGDYPDLVNFDTPDVDAKRIASEAIATGYIPGIRAQNANLGDFVVDRWQATAELPPRIMIRPKTPFGVVQPIMGEMLIISALQRGDVVQALKELPAADVKPGTLGVVFEERNAYKDEGGPMVRWMNMNCCNVYDGEIGFVRR